LTFILV